MSYVGTRVWRDRPRTACTETGRGGVLHIRLFWVAITARTLEKLRSVEQAISVHRRDRYNACSEKAARTVPRPSMWAVKVAGPETATTGPSAPVITTSPARSGVPSCTI